MKITAKQFETFKNECERWIEFFGLLDNEWHFVHKEDKENRACFYTDWAARINTIKLSTEWNCDTKVTKDELSFVAFHEVVECGLIGELRRMAGYTFNESEVDRASHEIVRRLENSVYKKLK